MFLLLTKKYLSFFPTTNNLFCAIKKTLLSDFVQIVQRDAVLVALTHVSRYYSLSVGKTMSGEGNPSQVAVRRFYAWVEPLCNDRHRLTMTG